MKRGFALWMVVTLLVCAVASAGVAWPLIWGWYYQTVVGTVTAVNAANKTITIQTTIRGLPSKVTLSVDPSAQIVRHSTTSISGLKEGDQIEVAGMPLVIQASKLWASAPSPAAGASAGGAGGTANPSKAVPSLRPDAEARAVGTVKSVDVDKRQAVIVLPDGKTEVTVVVPADLKVERRDVVTLDKVQVGDKARARVKFSFGGQAVIVALEVFEAQASATTPSAAGGTAAGGGGTG